MIQEDAIWQTATAQFLAHLFQDHLTHVIDWLVKVGIDLERQQAAQEAD
jgi:hypothetical protein